MAYKWKSGSRINVNADVAGEICESLASKGNLTGKALVDVSRPEDAPLHSQFEWDDSIAAEKYREEQGCHIIRCLTVSVDRDEDTPVAVRAFFVTTEANKYEPIQVVMSDNAKRIEMMKRAISELSAFKNKYSSLEELSGVFVAIDNVFKENIAHPTSG